MLTPEQLRDLAVTAIVAKARLYTGYPYRVKCPTCGAEPAMRCIGPRRPLTPTHCHKTRVCLEAKRRAFAAWGGKLAR